MKALKNITVLFSFFTFFLIFIGISSLSFSQTWSEPINISNMEGVDSQPNITIDKDGIIHCVWVHEMGTNYRKIYYSKSDDDGLSWTEPYDVSQNNEKWMGTPKIVADTNNKLYLTYQHNVGNYYKTVNVMRTCEDGVWSSYDTITAMQLGVVKNFLAIDNNNRLYAFWYWGQTTYYRYFENGNWSNCWEVYNDNGDIILIRDLKCDLTNVLHCVFSYLKNGLPSDSTLVSYSTFENNAWSDMEFIGGPTISAYSYGIDTDTLNYPHVAFRELIPNLPAPVQDSTVYIHKSSLGWSDMEVLATDPFRQKILIDENNKPNVFDIEKLYVDSSMLIHHFKEYSWWESIIVDKSPNASIQYSIGNYNSMLIVVYNKPIEDNASEIMFSKTDILTKSIKSKSHQNLIVKIFPNPFELKLNIQFKVENNERVTIMIYDYNGKLIKTLLNRKISIGDYQLSWDGTDKNGNKIPKGNYLLRLIVGKRIISRPIVFVN